MCPNNAQNLSTYLLPGRISASHVSLSIPVDFHAHIHFL